MPEILGTRGSLWRVASPYFTTQTVRWINESIPEDVYRFERVNEVGGTLEWHSRRTARSSGSEWKDYFRQANNTLASPSDGLISVFPQLALSMSVVSRARRDERPIVSWFFNTTLERGPRLRAASAALSRVDRFVVHSTAEAEQYPRQLGLPADRFRFVPLQYGSTIETKRPATDEPFVFATGSGFRDYATFFAAMEVLGYRTIVLAGPRALHGLTPPRNVEIVDSMSKPEIRRHVRHAAVNVIPLRTVGVTAGLVTIVECLRHGRGIVSTERSGTEDYLTDGENALLALPGNVNSLASRIEAVWTDPDLSQKLDTHALEFGEEYCTDEAAAQALIEVLDGVRMDHEDEELAR